MHKRRITTTKAPKPGGSYSEGLLVKDLVFVAGQGPLNRRGEIVGDTIEEQTAATLDNIRAILEAGGASMADVVKATVHLRDLNLFDRYDAVYADYFPDPKPVRTTVGSSLLRDMLIEIDVIAVHPGHTP
jgi:2-iminobutanoate/2-iminopropanoate deaminase